MKKYILLVVSAVALAFTSCSDSEEIEINSEVDITINPSTVKSAFRGYFVNNKVSGIDMRKGAELLISAFIYDENGMYVDHKEFHVNDYTSKANFSLAIPNDRWYTVVAITYSVLKNGQASSYKVENYDERIEDLKITQVEPTGASYYSNWGMLGIKVQEVYPNNKNTFIDVEPASSLVAVLYRDIHAYDELGVDNHTIIFVNNDYVQFENNIPCYGNSLSNNAGHVNSVDVTLNNGNAIYDILYLLPKNQMHMEACMFIGEYRIDYASLRQEIGADPSYGYTKVDIRAGKEYVLEVDCPNLAISVEQLSSSKSIKVDSKTKQDVNANSNPYNKLQSLDVMTFMNY